MSEKQEVGYQYLDLNSPEYNAHKEEINALYGEVVDVSSRSFAERRTEIFHTEGASRKIVCSRPKDDYLLSVSGFFYAQAVQLFRDGQLIAREQENALITRRREMIFRLLAIRLSIGEQQSNPAAFDVENPPVDWYHQALETFEHFCMETDSPSVFPSLYSAGALSSRLRDEHCVPDNERAIQVHTGLAHLLSYQPNHLHAVLSSLQRARQHQKIVELIGEIAEAQGLPLLDFLYKHLSTLELYVISLFMMQQYDEVISVCRTIDPDTMKKTPYLLQKYLDAFTQLNRMDDMILFMEQYDGPFFQNPAQQKTLGIACEQAGWFLYGQGKYEEGIAFLQRFLACEMGEQGRVNINDLFLFLLKETGDQARIDAFKKKCGDNYTPDVV